MPLDVVLHHAELISLCRRYQGGEPHPFMSAIDPVTGLCLTDKFRAVHDHFGHCASGFGFGPRGEENAWHVHSQMFSWDARRALTTETRGQNCWVNFARHNFGPDRRHRDLPLYERPYDLKRRRSCRTSSSSFRPGELAAVAVSHQTSSADTVF